MKCVACGSTALVEGTLLDTNGADTYFKLKETSTLKFWFGIGTRKVRAYGCLHCSHLQYEVEFTDKDLERYQEFEGEQPDVIERINRESKED